MKHFARATLSGALFASFLLIGTIPAFAQCDEGDPNCPIEPPQSVEVDPDAVEAEGSTTDIEDPGALEAVESELSGEGPAIIDPVPLAPRAAIAPAFGRLTIPMRWQQPTDVSCGVQALGMAFEGLGDSSPSSPAILDFLQNQGMMYDFGTGVEELAFSAQNFGYKGTIPFHNWGLEQLQAELAEGRAPVVALGSNGPGQPGHFVTVTGFSPDGEWASYNDPILGEQVVAIDEFNRLWGLQGNSGVAVRKTVPAGEIDPVPWVAFVAGLMALISQTPWALQRKGIGGRLMAGGSTSRRRTRPARRRSLGGVPSRAAKAAVRRKPPKSRPTPRPRPPRDPSPQMYNQPLVPNNKTEKLVWKAPESEPVLEPVPSFFSNPLGWVQAKIINAGRKDEKVRDIVASTLGPASRALRKIGEWDPKATFTNIREKVGTFLKNGVDGWKRAAEGYAALIGFTARAAIDGRWDDVKRAFQEARQIPGQTVDAVIEAYEDLPFVAQVGIGIAPGGDLADITREVHNLVEGEKVDTFVLGFSLVGLVLDLGWLNGPIPDPVDGANATASLLKNLLKHLPAGPARNAVEQMIKNPDEWGRIIDTAEAIAKNADELKLLDNPELLVWLLRKGPDGVEYLVKYGDEAAYAIRAAERLADVGKHSDEAADLIDSIMSASIHGSGDRVVIGKFIPEGEGTGYIQEALENGGIYFDTPDGLYNAMKGNRALMEEINGEFLLQQMDSGVSRIDLVGETIEDVLSGPRSSSFTAFELRFLAEHAPEFGYVLRGNSWIRP